MPTRDEDRQNGSFQPGPSAPRYQLVSLGKWQWLEEYALLKATYYIACPTDRQCQVGMGIFSANNPLGEKIRFSGVQEVTVLGAGSIHVRVMDNKGPCWVAISQTDRSLISVFSSPDLEVCKLVAALRERWHV